jgi:hypothetical protein
MDKKQDKLEDLDNVKKFIINEMPSKYVQRKMGYDPLSEDELFDDVNKLLISTEISDKYNNHLLPYFRSLYNMVYSYLDRMLRNYHKFILNQHRGIEVYNLVS